MSQKAEFHNLAKPDDGLLRELAKGVTTRIFAGEQAMLSVVIGKAEPFGRSIAATHRGRR